MPVASRRIGFPRRGTTARVDVSAHRSLGARATYLSPVQRGRAGRSTPGVCNRVRRRGDRPVEDASLTVVNSKVEAIACYGVPRAVEPPARIHEGRYALLAGAWP